MDEEWSYHTILCSIKPLLEMNGCGAQCNQWLQHYITFIGPSILPHTSAVVYWEGGGGDGGLDTVRQD